jgi:hypothetical protein
MDEIKYGRNTTMLLNRNPVVPTYEEIAKFINEVKKKYPRLSFDKVINRLNYEVIAGPRNI